MTIQEIVDKIKVVKEGYVNGQLDSEELVEFLDDLCCEIEGCNDSFNFACGDDDFYQSFEETDFTQLEL